MSMVKESVSRLTPQANQFAARKDFRMHYTLYSPASVANTPHVYTVKRDTYQLTNG